MNDIDLVYTWCDDNDEKWRDRWKRLLRPGMVFLNDTEATSTDDRRWLRNTFETLFAGPSSFEKEGA